MKKNILKISILLLITVFAVVLSCKKKEYDVPPTVPTVNFQSNKSIKALIAGYEGGVDTIKEDWVIKGVISANDETGNFYKTLYLQDDSAGINIQIDRTNMFNEFKVGQEVYIKLQGLSLGSYGGMIQIGYPYVDAGSLTTGRIPDILVNDHLFRNGLPGAEPQIKTINNINLLTNSDLGRLIKLTGVVFETPCEVYSIDYTSTSNNIIDSLGNIIVLRTSNYATFRGSTLPNDTGSVVGIYSTYNGAKQFTIRDLNDVKFLHPCESTNLINEGFAAGNLGVFHQFSVLGPDVWMYGTYGGKNYATVTGYTSGLPNEDWLISPSVNLDAYSDESMIFETATKYGAPAGTLKLFYSTDYSGTGTPVGSSWIEIPGINLSTGNFTWVSSGNIDLTAISGTNVHFAFKFTCTSNSPTWELTNIRLRGKKN